MSEYPSELIKIKVNNDFFKSKKLCSKLMDSLNQIGLNCCLDSENCRVTISYESGISAVIAKENETISVTKKGCTVNCRHSDYVSGKLRICNYI